MTDHRDLKRRVRERQARTGESYMTARRHVLAQRPAEPADPKPSEEPSEIDVVEPHDVSEEAASLGLRCRVLMFPSLVAQLPAAAVLEKLRDALLASAGDREYETLCNFVLRGEPPRSSRRLPRDFEAHRRFDARVRAGIGGLSPGGRSLAMHLAGRDGLVPIGCTIWHTHVSIVPALVLMAMNRTDDRW